MILFRRHPHFTDRDDAARQLAAALSRLRGANPLVLAIPRGGVPIGRIVADALQGELDVILVRKLGAPGNPEFAIGAIDEDGNVQLAGWALEAGGNAAYVEREAARQLAVIRSRRALYSPLREPIDPAGRTVIVVDDGLATGATMAAALNAVRAHQPSQLICAVPVAAERSIDSISRFADEVVCLSAPEDFRGVGEFYGDFSAVGDDEVIALLDRGSASPAQSQRIRLAAGAVQLDGDLEVPDGAIGLVVFAHGSGSSRKSSRNRFVAAELIRCGLATLLFDLLTEEEDADRANRFDIGALAARLDAAVGWTRSDPRVAHLPLGLFGASTGAAAALTVAAHRRDGVQAVVSRGGRPDLAGREALARVAAPTLLIVGAADVQVLDLNRAASRLMNAPVELSIVSGATHLFEEPGALAQAADLAARWFQRWLGAR